MVRARPKQVEGADVATSADPTGSNRRTDARTKLPKLLGWLTLGLGAAEVAVPDRVARLVGAPDDDTSLAVVRAMGVRELSVVPGLFNKPRPAGFLAARVAGDLLDLALLGVALRARRSDPARVRAAMAAVAGVTLLDLVAAVRASRSADATTSDGAIRARTAVTVNRSPDDVYGFWHDLERLPEFMAHLESVRREADGRSHWVARGPARRRIEWDAEVIDDVPAQVIAWRSLPGARVANRGSVRFAPGPAGRGTEVTVDLEYDPPGGAAGAAFARLFGEEPEQQLRDDLRRFKQVAETGEVARSDGTPQGTHTRAQLRQRAGQPG